MKKIVFIIAFLFLFYSCKREEQPQPVIDYDTSFSILNNSGMKVAVVPVSRLSHIPDSLVLENGEVYSWGVFTGPFLLYNETDPVKVYFNETVSMLYQGELNQIGHDPRNVGNYICEILSDGLEYFIYTFTPEDYERALE